MGTVPNGTEIGCGYYNRMVMKIYEVSSNADLDKFVCYPFALYKGDENFVPPIIKNEKSRIKLLAANETEIISKYWYAGDKGKVKGRIAAHYRKNDPKGEAKFSNFDSEKDTNISALLLSVAEAWAKKQGATKIHGPLGLTSFDKSGVLVEGYSYLPTIYSCYNKDYYDHLLISSGYTKEYDWVEYLIKVPDSMPDKIIRGSKLVRNRYKVGLIGANSVRSIRKYNGQILEVLNAAYQSLDNFTTLGKTEFDEIFDEFAKVIVPDLTAFVKNSSGELIGFGIALPSFSKAFIKAKGKLFPFGFIHFNKAKRNNDTVDFLLIAIRPEYQSKGVHAPIFEKIIDSLHKRNIRFIESTKELENNYKVQNLWHDYDYKQHKRSRCYHKVLK